MKKGDFQGLCNRTVCSNRAHYLNLLMGKYYCYQCAIKLTEANKDLDLKFFEGDLVTLEKERRLQCRLS